MSEKEQLIKNYFIILQQSNFNRDEAIRLYFKYESILNKPFLDCIFDFESIDKKVLDNFTDEVEDKAESVFNISKNGNILFYKDSEYTLNIHNKKDTLLPPVLFYHGNISLLGIKSISVVGTRNPSDTGRNNAERIARFLMKNELAIASGLAKGIDQITHETARQFKYKRIIGVIGTPLNKSYPKENKNLQKYVAAEGLLISEYAAFETTTRLSFLRRNYIMSCISRATIVVEAGDTSGSINQARHTLKNGKRLMVPRGVFENPDNSWPTKFRNDYGLTFEFGSFADLQELIKGL